MRILYFSRDYTTHDRRFLFELAQTKHTIYFLRLENDHIPYEKRPLPEEVQSVPWNGGNKIASDVKTWLSFMPEFEAIISEIKPDVVQSGPVQSCGLMTALSGFHPFLVVSWGSDILVDAQKDDMWQWMTAFTLRNADMLLCDSNAVRDTVQQMVLFPDEDIVQFPWGVNLSHFSPNVNSTGLRQELEWDSNFVVLSTRSWEQIYGIDALLKAFQQAYSNNPRLRLLMLGTGSLSEFVEQYIAENQLQGVICRKGMVPHHKLPAYFSAADLYLSCAQSDGASISLLEAMATGLPVVVTDAPGNREWVVQNENGWLASGGNVNEFASLLLLAAGMDETGRREIGKKNRHLAEKHANWHANFPQLVRALERLVTKGT